MRKLRERNVHSRNNFCISVDDSSNVMIVSCKCLHHMREPPNKCQQVVVFVFPPGGFGGSCFEAKLITFPKNIDLDLGQKTNLSRFEYLIMIMEAIEVQNSLKSRNPYVNLT